VKQFSIFLLSAVLFYACQKEVNFDTDTRIAGQGKLLKSATTRQGQDSGSQSFAYDANKRIISITGDAYASATNGLVLRQLQRNNTGIIQSYTYIQKIPAAGIDDTATYTVVYDVATQRYKYRVYAFDFFGDRVVDSIVYTYNASGKIIKAETFAGSARFGIATQRRYEYQYTGDNVKEVQLYDLDPANNTVDLSVKSTFEFDTDIAALTLGNEAIIMDMLDWISANNATKQSIVDVRDGSGDAQVIYSYNFGSFAQPQTAVRTITPIMAPQLMSNSTFEYYP
jgi:hypothetical protein